MQAKKLQVAHATEVCVALCNECDAPSRKPRVRIWQPLPRNRQRCRGHRVKMKLRALILKVNIGILQE